MLRANACNDPLAKQVDGGSGTGYPYDGQSLLEESNLLGNPLARYHYSATELVSRTDIAHTATRQYLSDALHTPIATQTSTGIVDSRTQYDRGVDVFELPLSQASTTLTLAVATSDSRGGAWRGIRASAGDGFQDCSACLLQQGGPGERNSNPIPRRDKPAGVEPQHSESAVSERERYELNEWSWRSTSFPINPQSSPAAWRGRRFTTFHANGPAPATTAAP
jgi:hypothetical protein